MKRISKIVSRVLIVVIIVMVIIFITISLANYLSNKKLMFADTEVCERCFGSFICWNRVELDPCDVIDGKFMFYSLAGIFWLSLFLILQYIGENSDFSFDDWIKGK